MGVKERESKYLAIYYLRTIEKKKIHEIAAAENVSIRTVFNAIDYVRKESGLTEQQSGDIINFYEHEMRTLQEMREQYTKQPRFYIQFTNQIIELQDKIAELLKLKNSVAVQVNNQYKTFVYLDSKALEEAKTGEKNRIISQLSAK